MNPSRPPLRVLAAMMALGVVAACGGSGSADRRSEPSDLDAPTPSPVAVGADDPACVNGVRWSPIADPDVDTSPATDLSTTMGLDRALVGIRGHAVAAGDVDGDGWTDVFVGTFADRPVESYAVRGADGPAPDRLLLGGADGFTLDDTFPGALGRTSGAAFADLDLDGDLDLVVARNPRPGERSDAPSVIVPNESGSWGTPIVLDTERSARTVAVLDYDADGRPDIFLVADRFGEGSSVLYRNTGDLAFVDDTEAAGLPSDLVGLSAAAADLNDDSLTDLHVGGTDSVFLNEGGTFRAAPGPPAWERFGDEDDPAGVAAADLDADGLIDLVVGQHYNSTVDFGERVPIRVFRNTGPDDDGNPGFEDLTEAAGIEGFPTKAPHVDVVDLDADGRPDIVTTASADDGRSPAVLMNTSDDNGLSFAMPDGLGSTQYWVAGAVLDADHNGTPDLFLVEWEPEVGSVLQAGPEASGSRLIVGLDHLVGPSVGAVVRAYEAGRIDDRDALVAVAVIEASTGYGSGTPLVADLGVGPRSEVDLVVIPANRQEPIRLAGVATDGIVLIGEPESC